MKTKKMIACLSTIALATTMTGCAASASKPEKPTDKACNDWDWDSENGVYECDQKGSSHYGHYYYGGTYYSNQTSLKSSSGYKSYKSSSSFKGSSGAKSSTGTSGSGFGKGSTSTGG